VAYEITERARDLADEIQLKPNIVICFPSLGLCYGGEITKVIPRFGDPGLVFGLPDLTFGALVPSPSIDEYISLSGTTSDITQQLDPDKAAATSTQQITVKLADLNQDITGLISPGIVTDDLLYEFAQVYLGHQESAFPEDYIELFNGNVANIVAGSGFVDLTISHPEERKRTEIFPKLEKKLAKALNFNSLTVQDLFYQARPDVVGTLSIEYVAGGIITDDAVVTVTGNIISVAINITLTKAKTIKKAIENSADANQLVTVKVKTGGNANAVQAFQSLTAFQTDLEIELDDISQMLLPVSPVLRTYVVIDDEIIEYTGINIGLKKLTGCSRAALTSFGIPHELNADVVTFYKYGDNTQDNGNAIDLALWLMMSNGPANYAESVDVGNFLQVSPSLSIPNAIFFPAKDLVQLYGVVVGDKCSVTGALNGANNFVDRTIQELVIDENGSYIVVDGASLVTEVASPGVISFKSQYNILPDGVGLKPVQVDIAEFKRKKDLYFSSLAFYEFYFKDTIDPKKLINEEIFLPSAFFSIPRKGRISLGVTAPPLFDPNSQELTLDTVEKPKNLKVTRGIGRNFYNSVVYKYNEDSVEDKRLSGSITLSTNSTSRIEVANKPLVIDARGLRPSGNTALLIERNTARFLSRYEYAAETIEVEVPFRIGWTTEVGDSIVFGEPRLQVSDSTRGDRNFEPRIFEIINKKLNWRTGAISLSLLDTNFNQSVRYGVWSPATILGAGSTTTSLVLTLSYGQAAPKKERDKWSFYIGKQIVVHSYDWSTQYLTRITGFDPSDDQRLLVEAMPAAPLAGWEITLPEYDDIEPTDSRIYKSIHPFWTPQIEIVSGISQTQFTVAALDAAKLFVGGIVRVHDYSYSIDSGLVSKKITGIAGTTITCESLGFTPVAGQFVDLIGFVSDEGAPYVWL
jgi:hypothetical protein